jgi:hypothetical protein
LSKNIKSYTFESLANKAATKLPFNRLATTGDIALFSLAYSKESTTVVFMSGPYILPNISCEGVKLCHTALAHLFKISLKFYNI